MGILLVIIGNCTYLATAHCIVWDCLVFWVLELVLPFCSAWPPLIVAGGSSWVAVRWGSAWSPVTTMLCSDWFPHTLGWSSIIWGGNCSAWSSSRGASVAVGHGSARISALHFCSARLSGHSVSAWQCWSDWFCALHVCSVRLSGHSVSAGHCSS